MLPKCLGFAVAYRTNIQPHRPWHHQRRRSIRNRKVRRHVIEPFRLVRASRLRIPLRLPGPVKRRCRQHRSHHMIGVRIEPTISPKGQHHIWLESPDPFHQPPRRHRKLNKLKPPILVIHQLMVPHPQHLAGSSKLLPPHLAQSFTRRRIAAIRRSLAIGQANDVGLNPTLSIERQRSAKSKTLIIWMRGDTHQLQSHSAASRSASSNSSSGETRFSIAASGSTSRTGAKLLRCSGHGPISTSARRCSGVPYPLCEASP